MIKRLVVLKCISSFIPFFYIFATLFELPSNTVKNSVINHVRIPIPEGEDYNINITSFPVSSVQVHMAIASISSKDDFHVMVNDSNCSLKKTSAFSKQASCSYAVNGGPFQSYIHGGCIGITISNGRIINCSRSFQSSVEDNDVAFGVTQKNEWVIGNVQDYSNTGEDYSDIKELITGLNGWLVKNSTIVPHLDKKRHAPRTAIGINRDAHLVLFQVDGCEHCHTPTGLTMHELAREVSKHALYSINLDGGGSSTTVGPDGKVLNHPTCMDYLNIKCERKVASALCVKPGHMHSINQDAAGASMR